MSQVISVQSADGLIIKDENHNAILSVGTTVPTDGDVGHAPGAEFLKTDGTVGAARYVNEGTASSAAYKAQPIINTTQAFINIPFTAFREIISNDIGNAAANGGILASDTTPILNRVNAATDKQFEVSWAATNVDPIAAAFALPPDLDRTADIVVHMYGEMGGTTDTPTIAVSSAFDFGDTPVADATDAFDDTPTERTATIDAGDIPDSALVCSIELTPGAHGTDSLNLYGGVWIEYTRQTLTS